MAAKPLSAEQIREILRLHSEDKLSNREIARRLIPRVNKETVNRYVGFVRNNKLDIGTLLKMGDEELDRVFHKGDPAYADQEKMDLFISDIPLFKEERTQQGMTAYRMWLNHSVRHLQDCYELAQFCYHLRRAGLLPPPKRKPEPKLEKRIVSAIITIGDCTTTFYNQESRDMEKVHFVAIYMVLSRYMRICPVRTLAIGEIVGTINDILSKIGGVPHSLVTDNLRRMCTRPDNSVPPVGTVLKDLASYYMFDSSFNGEKDAYSSARTDMGRAFNHLNHALAGEKYSSMGEILKDVSVFEERYNRTRIRKADFTREESFLKDEQPWLTPLRQPEYEIVAVCTHKVNEDGTVQAGKDTGTGFYSVPAAYIGKKVRCLLSSKTVTILDTDELIAEHSRVGFYRYSIQEEHGREWEASEYNNTHILLLTADNFMGSLGAWMRLYFNETVTSGHRAQECHRRYHRIMRMAYADIPAMDTACRICLQKQIYSYKGLKDHYELHHKKK